jgi:hypothetical protein
MYVQATGAHLPAVALLFWPGLSLAQSQLPPSLAPFTPPPPPNHYYHHHHHYYHHHDRHHHHYTTTTTTTIATRPASSSHAVGVPDAKIHFAELLRVLVLHVPGQVLPRAVHAPHLRTKHRPVASPAKVAVGAGAVLELRVPAWTLDWMGVESWWWYWRWWSWWWRAAAGGGGGGSGGGTCMDDANPPAYAHAHTPPPLP